MDHLVSISIHLSYSSVFHAVALHISLLPSTRVPSICHDFSSHLVEAEGQWIALCVAFPIHF